MLPMLPHQPKQIQEQVKHYKHLIKSLTSHTSNKLKEFCLISLMHCYHRSFKKTSHLLSLICSIQVISPFYLGRQALTHTWIHLINVIIFIHEHAHTYYTNYTYVGSAINKLSLSLHNIIILLL
jgi:hypothetical protein